VGSQKENEHKEDESTQSFVLIRIRTYYNRCDYYHYQYNGYTKYPKNKELMHTVVEG